MFTDNVCGFITFKIRVTANYVENKVFCYYIRIRIYLHSIDPS
jgi:hypothetical protein